MKIAFAACLSTAAIIAASAADAQVAGAAPGQAFDLSAPVPPDAGAGQSYAIAPVAGASRVLAGSIRVNARLSPRLSRSANRRLNGGLDVVSAEALQPRDPRDSIELKRTTLETEGTLLPQPK